MEVLDLVPEGCKQANLFEETASTGSKTLMEAMDKINKALGKEVVRLAVQGFEKIPVKGRIFVSLLYHQHSTYFKS